jgi:hypothetical protein
MCAVLQAGIGAPRMYIICMPTLSCCHLDNEAFMGRHVLLRHYLCRAAPGLFVVCVRLAAIEQFVGPEVCLSHSIVAWDAELQLVTVDSSKFQWVAIIFSRVCNATGCRFHVACVFMHPDHSLVTTTQPCLIHCCPGSTRWWLHAQMLASHHCLSQVGLICVAHPHTGFEPILVKLEAQDPVQPIHSRPNWLSILQSICHQIQHSHKEPLQLKRNDSKHPRCVIHTRGTNTPVFSNAGSPPLEPDHHCCRE